MLTLIKTHAVEPPIDTADGMRRPPNIFQSKSTPCANRSAEKQHVATARLAQHVSSP